MTPEERKEKVLALATDRRVQLMVLVFLVALVPRIAFMEHGLWQDEGRAMTVARNALQGEGFHFRHKPMTQHPFLFYIILALSFAVLGAKEVVGFLVVNTFGALTAVVAYLIGEELYNRYAGVAAGLFLALSPIHWMVSTRVLTDTPVSFFMALAAYLLIKAERTESRRYFAAAVLATAAAGLTKLTGLLIVPVLVLYAAYNKGIDVFTDRRYWAGIGGFIALFGIWELRNLLVVGHTVALRRGLQVFFFLSGKSGGGGVGNTNPLFYVTSMPSFLGVPVLAFFIVGLAAIYLVHVRDAPKEFSPLFRKLLYAAGGISGLVALGALLMLVVGGGKVPVQFLLAGTAGVAVVASFFYVSEASFYALSYLLVIFTVFTLKTYNLHRYFLPFAPMAVVVAGYGVSTLCSAARSRFGRRGGLAVFVLLVGSSLGLMYGPGAANIVATGNSYTGLQEAGEWIAKRTDGDDIIMAASTNQMAWYTNLDNTKNLWPAPNKSAVDRYVRRHDVKFIEWDIWEPIVRKYAPYAPQHYIQSDNYRVVKVQRRQVRGQKRPYLIIFQPVFNESVGTVQPRRPSQP